MSNDIERIKGLVDYINENLSDVDGPTKAMLLKTVAAYYEHLSESEARIFTFKKLFNDIQ